MQTFPDLATAQAYLATVPDQKFIVSQYLDGSVTIVPDDQL